MEVLYLTKNGRIEHSIGNSIGFGEPVFIMWTSEPLENINGLNEFEKVFLSLNSWKFEIQPHMFSVKTVELASEPVYVVTVEPNPIEIPQDSTKEISVFWTPEHPEPPELSYVIMDEEVAFFDGEFGVFGKAEGRTQLHIIDVKTDKVLNTIEIEVFR